MRYFVGGFNEKIDLLDVVIVIDEIHSGVQPGRMLVRQMIGVDGRRGKDRMYKGEEELKDRRRLRVKACDELLAWRNPWVGGGQWRTGGTKTFGEVRLVVLVDGTLLASGGGRWIRQWDWFG